MRVALITEYLDGGGSERVVQRLAGELARRGHAIFVYCLQGDNPAAAALVPSTVVVREARSFGFDPALPLRLLRWLAADRIQIVHAHNCAALVRIFPAARMRGTPLVHVWHGWPPGPPTRDRRLALQLDRFADAVVVNSESLRARLPAGPLRRKAVCIHNGLDLLPQSRERACARLEVLCGRLPGRPLVLSIGNLRPEKGVLTLLRAIRQLRHHHPTVHLVCVGAVWDRAYWQHVKRAVHAYGLADCVSFPGPCQEAWRILAAADVFCLSSERESLPNVVLEAMSQRVPIVATAVGDVGRIDTTAAVGAAPAQRTRQDAAANQGHPRRWLLRHGQTALLVPPGDAPGLARALSQAIRDPAAARDRAQRAAVDFERYFDTARMATAYEHLYARLARRRASRRLPGPARKSGRPRVLMLGPAAPQLGGMVRAIDVLMRSPLRSRFALERFATTFADPRRPATCGRGLAALARGLDSAVRHIERLIALAGLIVTRRPRLVHVHTCSGATFWRNLLDIAVVRLLGSAVIVNIRGGGFGQFVHQLGPAGRMVVRAGLRAADAVILLSQQTRGALARFLGSARPRLHVVWNPVEPVRRVRRGRQEGRQLRPGTAQPPCRILYLAPLTAAKGLGDLLDAARMLRDGGEEEFELLIAGPAAGGDAADWQRQADCRGLAGCTRFIGPVYGRAKEDLLASADVFVHPSHVEALPNAVLEAAAAGLPVVTTAVGSLPEVLGETDAARGRQTGASTTPLVSFVPPHDPAALARALQALLHDPAGRRRMGDAARQFVEANLSPQKIADCLADIYETCLRPAARDAAAQASGVGRGGALKSFPSGSAPRQPVRAQQPREAVRR